MHSPGSFDDQRRCPRRHRLHGTRSHQDPAAASAGEDRRRHQPAGGQHARVERAPQPRGPARSAARGPHARAGGQPGRVRVQLPAPLRQRRDHPQGAGRRRHGDRLQRRLPARRCGDLPRMVWPPAPRHRPARPDGLRPSGTVSRPDQRAVARRQSRLLRDVGDPAAGATAEERTLRDR